MNPLIGVLAVGIGNLGSLTHAVYSQGYDWIPVRAPADLDGITHLIMPGVGSFSDAMQRVDASQLRVAVQSFVASGRPLMGICLGMQLLASWGEEGGGARGFGFVPGEVLRLPTGEGIRIPHVGWNLVHKQRSHPVLDRIRDDVDFYFVHSYRFHCERDEDALALTEHGGWFPSIVTHGNVIGTQFHPEKSQRNGLQLLDNFCQWNGKA